ncbi:hypothetical protein KAH81_08455 [bacterium]|nr:hypothetical protein [bacterium]
MARIWFIRLASLLMLAIFVFPVYPNLTTIPINDSQGSPGAAYIFAESKAYTSWMERGTFDAGLATEYGEVPILWSASALNRGNFLWPDTLSSMRPFDFGFGDEYSPTNYPKAFSISIPGEKSIAIIKGSVLDDYGMSCTWQYPYYTQLFNGLELPANVVQSLVDSQVVSFDWRTRVVIIPAFSTASGSLAVYMDETVERYPDLGLALNEFLSSGGTIYTEGNASYLLEAYGILPSGSIDINDRVEGAVSGFCDVERVNQEHPLGFYISTNGVYTVLGPTFNIAEMDTILRILSSWDSDDIGKPLVGIVHPTGGGRILLNAGMPTTGIITSGDERQWQYSANAILSAFAERAMHVRSVLTGVATDSVDVAPIALPVNRAEEFEVTIRLRNLWNAPITNVSVTEQLVGIFSYVATLSGPAPSSVTSSSITYNIGTIPANGELIIVYRLTTPPEDDPKWSDIDDYMFDDNRGYCRISSSTMFFTDPVEGIERWIYRNSIKGRFLFEADIVADADLNWKNILGEYFQPFKIWSIFENKERTAGLNTKYVQYIPLDIPIYWVDPMSIPIIRTPGGRFVDLLRGDYDVNRNGEIDPGEVYRDMDGDGNPDAWLDVNTMHPAPDTMIYEEIYWFNPWSDEFEDIDGDGIHPVDIDDDGIFEVEDPDDKIRALRCEWTWNLDPFPGYTWFDPYASWELWIDPPPLVGMALGAAEAAGSLSVDVDTISEIGDEPYYYSNWEDWMEFDTLAGEIIWKRLVYVHFGAYEGFVFVDDGDVVPDPDAIDVGHVPWPRREYIAVLNLGGNEPTMTSPWCDSSRYSWIEYNTIWGEPIKKKTPIRVSYTYYTPLPNPLQFEYISATYEITDPTSHEQMQYLPKYGDADLTFNLCASTEYSRYWLKVVGQDWGEFDFDYDGEGRGWLQTSPVPDSLGDGVVGYMVHEIPKGMGGYSIDLPRDAFGNIDVSELVDGFRPYMHHDSVSDTIIVSELPFKWQILIPQILIPPALDDDDFDGEDDWDDDFGDRFVSGTGYLHDVYPPLFGEDAEDSFAVNPWTFFPIEGDLAEPHEGWCPGADSSYGDDLCEHLGETRLTVHVTYEGKGYEGPVEINKGVWLVNEEIFGGSPWVQWSHAQFAFAKGHNISLWPQANPTVIPIHPDTVLLQWQISETEEPVEFDILYDPYLDGTGYGDVTITTHVGGREPSSLFQPDAYWNARIDPIYEPVTLTAIPWASSADSALHEAGYPRTETGTFLQIVVEVDNNTGNHWYQTTVTPDISALGSSELFLWYGCYPRPFVPQHVVFDSTGEPTIIPGDDPRTFTAGWRFNPSADEVLFQVGDTDGSIMIPEIQSSRRAYYIYHIKLDPNLPVGVHEIPMVVSAFEKHYTDPGPGVPVSYNVPTALFAIVRRDFSDGSIDEYAEIIRGQAVLSNIETELETYVSIENPSTDVKWAFSRPTLTNWPTLTNVSGASVAGSRFSAPIPSEVGMPWPPNVDVNLFWIAAKAIVEAPYAADELPLDEGATLRYNDFMGIPRSKTCGDIDVTARGALMRMAKRVSEVNGVPIGDDGYYVLEQGHNEMIIDMVATNIGNDIAYNIAIEGQVGADASFISADDTYPYTYNEDTKIVYWLNFAHIPPGEERIIPVRIEIERTEDDDLLELFCAFAAEFWDSLDLDSETRAVRYRPEDSDTIFYGVDLYFEDGDLSVSQAEFELGDAITLNAQVRIGGNTTAKNTVVRFMEGTQQIGSDKIIPELNPADSFTIVSTPYTIQDEYKVLYVMVDPDSLMGELDEKNNLTMFELYTGKGSPLREVQNFPNPFKDYTEFTYVLTKPMVDLTVKVFTVRGRPVRTFELCPTGVGYNSVGWDGLDEMGDQIANGTYIYKIIAEDGEGDNYEFTERIVRMK